MLTRNARQLLNTVKATFPAATFDQEIITPSCGSGEVSGIEGVQCAWSQVQQLFSSEVPAEDALSTVGPALLRFSRVAQDVMSNTASNYNMFRLCLGLMITGVATLLVSPAIYRECTRSAYTGAFLAFMVVAYGSMMFASSYVEEEQQFWYWICSGWLFYLHIRSESSKHRLVDSTGQFPFYCARLATVGLAIAQRLLRRWNQTGQKFTAEPDIARTFFPDHPFILWGLVMLTYADAGRRLFLNLPSTALLRLSSLVLTTLAFMFKLNFVAADSPELLADSFLPRALKGWPGSFSLVWQARLIFGGLGCYVLLAVVARQQPKFVRCKSSLAPFLGSMCG